MNRLLPAAALALALHLTGMAGEVVNSGPAAAAAWLKQSDAIQVLDVRTREEFDEGHLDHALRIPWSEKDFAAAAKKQLDPEKPVLVYCRSGNRSAKAAAELAKLGFKNIRQLEGGIIMWLKSGQPVVKTK